MAAQDLQRPEVPPAPPSLLAVPSGMEDAINERDATAHAQANSRSGHREFQNYSAMYYTGQAGSRTPRGAVGASPLSMVLSHTDRAASRSFRAAAAAAVARVASRV